MKKSLIFVFIFLVLINLTSINAQSDAPGLDQVPIVGAVQNISEGNSNISQIKSDYLKQEWRNVLQGTPVLAISDFFKNFNPFFKAVLGVEYSFSWAFVFALMLWLALFFLIYRPAKAIFNNKVVFGLIAAFVISSLIGLSGVIRTFVNVLNTAVTNGWIAVISFFIALFIVILFDKLGGTLKKKINIAKEKAAKERAAKDRKIIHTEAEIARNQLDEYGTSITE